MSKLGFMCHFNETTGRTILKNEMIFFALPFFHSFVSAVLSYVEERSLVRNELTVEGMISVYFKMFFKI